MTEVGRSERAVGRQGDGSPRLLRPRLTDQLIDEPLAAIVAPSGYGKSLLADELAERLGWTSVFLEIPTEAPMRSGLVPALRRALRSAGLAAVAEAIGTSDDPIATFATVLNERSDPLLVVIDEAQRLSASAAGDLERIARGMPARHHLLVISQRPLGSLAEHLSAVVREQQLAFTAAEMTALAALRDRFLDETETGQLMAATAGWPAAVPLAIDTGVIDPRPMSTGMAALVERLLMTVDRETQDSVSWLAHLPLLSPAVANAVEAGAFDRLEQSGIPIRSRPDGWRVMPDPVREVLLDRRPLDPDATRRAAIAYADAGEFQAAISLLLGRREFESLAGVLEKRRWQELQWFDQSELRALLSVIPNDIVDAHPHLLLAIARSAAARLNFRWHHELIERAARTDEAARDSMLQREIEAEQAASAATQGETDKAVAIAQEVLKTASADEAATRARASAALGRARTFARDDDWVADATRHLTEALTLARVAGESELMAAALMRLGYGVHFAIGELDAALNRLREAVEAVVDQPVARGTTLSFLSEVLVYAGKLDEAEAAAREMADLGRRVHDETLLGYHAWIRALIATQRDDAAALHSWLADAERHPGDWFEHPTGIEFLAAASEMCARLGDRERAAAYLARVEERCSVSEYEDVDQIALIARAGHAARFGDASDAEEWLVTSLTVEQMPSREVWHMTLLRALAASRAGRPADARALYARSVQEATALGYPDLPLIQEPLAVAVLAEPSAVDETPVSMSINVLGGFSVTAAGRLRNPPVGQTATLVKLLAVSGGSVASDEALEVLWPDGDPETGRARLRNVLARIRSASGDLIRRDGTALALAPDVLVDADAFDADAVAALSGSGPAALAAARRAVSRYTGELLPADRYEDYTVVRRERLALRYLALLDRLATEAAAGNDIDDALRFYGEAIAAAPLEEHRYVLAASLALKHGRRQRARELVDQARRVMDELDVEPSEAIQAVIDALA